MSNPSGVNRDLIHVLLADSNQTQSQLLSSALRRQPSLRIFCCGGDVVSTLKAMSSTPIDVVLLGNGPTDLDRLMATILALHANQPHVSLILLIDSYDRNLVVKALRAGVRGLFCRASQPFRNLCRCIKAVHRGQYWANTEQVGYVIDALNAASCARVVNARNEGMLTPRQEQIVNLVLEGICNREIAQQLGIKENTVKKSLFRTYEKLGVSNRVELALYALSHRSSETTGPTLPKRPSGSAAAGVECLGSDPRNVLVPEFGPS